MKIPPPVTVAFVSKRLFRVRVNSFVCIHPDLVFEPVSLARLSPCLDVSVLFCKNSSTLPSPCWINCFYSSVVCTLIPVRICKWGRQILEANLNLKSVHKSSSFCLCQRLNIPWQVPSEFGGVYGRPLLCPKACFAGSQAFEMSSQCSYPECASDISENSYRLIFSHTATDEHDLIISTGTSQTDTWLIITPRSFLFCGSDAEVLGCSSLPHLSVPSLPLVEGGWWRWPLPVLFLGAGSSGKPSQSPLLFSWSAALLPSEWVGMNFCLPQCAEGFMAD